MTSVFVRGKGSLERHTEETLSEDAGRDWRNIVTNPGMLGQLLEGGKGKEWILP